jgi:DNA polymerase elongation subunit (family B)
LKQLDKEHPDYKRYKTIDFALKTQIAAFSHGIFGWSNSRMREYSVADAITAVVRDILNKIKTTCDLSSLKWVYVHTDSCYVNAKKEDAEKILNYLNECIKKHCKGYKITPELEMKGYYKIGYIHSPARNVLVPEGVEIDDDENWEESGMNFARSETPLPLANIEIALIKMKLKRKGIDEMLVELEEMVMKLPEYPMVELALIKPFNKRISEYGKPKQDGSIGNIPFHITALKRAQEEYGLKIPLKEKFGILPIITDEFTGVRVKKRKKVMMAFDLEKGLPESYKIDFETYLDGNLFGKVNSLFGLKVKDLKHMVLSERVKERLGI